MYSLTILLPILGSFVTYVTAEASVWGRCGGSGWTGPTNCASGSTCVASNEWYSQCIPESESDITFCLAGDSTTATAGGWGDAFCNSTLLAGVTCRNLAKGGATTSSFIAGTSGRDWTATLDCVSNAKNSGKTFVTIQFGHNDQKNGDSYRPTFSANLERMAGDVVKLGAHPIFVTSLARRNYQNGTIVDILEPWAALTRQAASTTKQPYIELLKTSIKYLNAIGSAAAWRLNYLPSDNTHINDDGGIVFSRMVADLIAAGGIISPNPFKADVELSQQITDGIPSF